MSAHCRYAVLIVFDQTFTRFISITKNHGPVYLLGKIGFPGGKLEENETALDAAVREMEEETGLVVPADQWLQVAFRAETAEKPEMTTFAAIAKNFADAETRECEPISQLNVAEHCSHAAREPDRYCPNFLEMLAQAEAALLLAQAKAGILRGSQAA